MVVNIDSRDYCMLLRRKNNIKLQTVADFINCSVSILSRWERGEGNISDEKVILYLNFIKKCQLEL